MVPLNDEPENAVFAIIRTSIADDIASLAINHAIATESCRFSQNMEDCVPHKLHTWTIVIPKPGGPMIRPASMFSQPAGSTLKGKT